MRDGRVLPFRMLQARLQRKEVDESLVREVPIAYVVFDMLARGGELLIDEPLQQRREQLERLRLDGPAPVASHRSRRLASSRCRRDQRSASMRRARAGTKG